MYTNIRIGEALVITPMTNTRAVTESQSEDLAEALEQRMKQLSADAETLQSMGSVRPPADPNASFSSADDDDIAAALATRVDGGEAEPVDDEAPLTGAPYYVVLVPCKEDPAAPNNTDCT